MSFSVSSFEKGILVIEIRFNPPFHPTPLKKIIIIEG